MSAVKTVLVTLLAGVLSIGIAVLGERWLGDTAGRPAGQHPAQHPLSALSELAGPDAQGAPVNSRDWAGKLVVLHYWATWCPTCLEQIPLLAASQRRHAGAPLQVLGVAIDRPADVAAFLADHPLEYPSLIGDEAAMALAKRLGNRVQGLPFTLIFDRTGRVAFSQTGALSADLLERQLARLLAPEDARPPADG